MIAKLNPRQREPSDGSPDPGHSVERPAQLRQPTERRVKNDMSIASLAEKVAGKRLWVPKPRGLGEVTGLIHVRGRPRAVQKEYDEYKNDLKQRVPRSKFGLLAMIGN
jgi:hypothetical protein